MKKAYTRYERGYNSSVSTAIRDDMVGNALAARRPIDWSVAAEWTACVTEDRLGPIHHAFRQEGAQGPVVVWNPGAADMTAAPLEALVSYWSTLREGDALPKARSVDPIGMRRSLGYVMLLEEVEDGRDFRYRVYGSSIAAVSGFDMTGRLLSEHSASAYLLEFSLALYRAVIHRREPVFCRYAPSGTLLTAEWHRTALPLTDEEGRVVRFLAGAVPLGRDGRIVSMRL